VEDAGVKSGGSSSSSKILLAVFFIVVVFLSYRFFSAQSPAPVYAYGVKVVSDKPLGEYTSAIQSKGLTLLDTELRGGITCNFELLAALPRSLSGYRISVEEGEQGIFLYEKEGFIKGMSEREVVTACNAFVCIAGNITCPSSVADLGKVFSNVDELNIVLDSNGGQSGGMAYAELLGVLGFMQAKKIDVNKDNVISDFELNNMSGNFIAIRPYLKYNNTCRPQPLNNLVERFTPDENLTVECSLLSETIFVLNSSENKIVVEDSNIYIYGDESHVYPEAVIVRDALAPDWVRALYQVGK